VTKAEYDRRRRERYRKVMLREMTLEDALAENHADWLRLLVGRSA